MATTSDCVEVAIHLQEGDTKTIKVWRFDGDQLPGYTHERVEQEILELFPHIEKKDSVCGCTTTMTLQERYILIAMQTYIGKLH